MFGRASLVSLSILLFAATPAHANGRFPQAQRLIEDPRDPDHLLLAATYGLLTTKDRGKTWYYSCERAFSQEPDYIGDPLLELTEDGTQLVGVQTDLNRSLDGGCEWKSTRGGTRDEYIPDYALTADANGQRNALVLLSAALEGSKLSTRVLHSPDAGETFENRGDPLPIATAFTIDAAPSNPDVIYVSALTASGDGVLLVSVNGGETFEQRVIPDTGPSEVPYIAAVDRSDPNTLYVRTDSKAIVNARETANDALLVSHDAGETWTELYRAHAKLLGFALSPDGNQLALGYAAPEDARFAFDAEALGIVRSSTQDIDFARVSAANISCLTWTEQGLYACTTQVEEGYALGFIGRDELAQSGSPAMTRLLDLPSVRGPACCDSPAAGLCDAAWLGTCFQLSACYTTPDSGPPFTCSGIGAEGGSSGGPTAPKSEGCGCRVAGEKNAGDGALQGALAGGLALLFGTRRRRRT